MQFNGLKSSASRPAFFSGGCRGKSISLPFSAPREQVLCCWKRVFAKTRAFSSQNSVSFGPALFVFQGQTCLLVQISLDFLLLYFSPLWWKGHLFWVCVCVLDLEGLLGLLRTHQLQLLWHLWLGYRLRFLSYWMVCFENEPRSFCHLWDCTQVYCILDTFVDYEGYSLSSKGFLPSVGDIMVSWINFTHFPSILVHWFLKYPCLLLPSPVWPHPIYRDSET